MTSIEEQPRSNPPLNGADAAVSDDDHNEKNVSMDDDNLQTDDDDISVDVDHEELKAWDEGGASDCGYSQGVHDTLMSIGGGVHNVVGDPTSQTKSAMGQVGNWFQEMSYAVRDIFRGKTQDMEKDSHGLFSETVNHVNQLMRGKKEDEAEEKKDEAEEKKDEPPATTSPTAASAAN